jgi:hypothetical protein
MTTNKRAYTQQTTVSLRKLRSAYNLPQSFLSAIGDSPVAILPWDLLMGPAYALNEVELPIAQLYVANTESLDARDAAWLQATPPKWVVLSLPQMDGHYPLWTAPMTYATLLSQYQVVEESSSYALLKHDPVTVTSRSIHEVTGSFGSLITTPLCSSGTLTASLGLHLNAKGRLNHVINHVEPPKVSIVTASGAVGPFRLVWSSAADGLMMSNVVSSVSELPSFGSPSSKSPAIQGFRLAGTSDFSNSFTVRFVCHTAHANRS